MLKIFLYSLYDLSRTKWIYLYLLFYLMAGYSLLYLNNDLVSGMTNLMNISLLLCPLISSIFSSMYHYNSKDFIELLLSQPIKRNSILLGQYLGLSSILAIGYFVGVSVPFLSYGILVSPRIFDFSILLLTGTGLTFIFTALAILISVKNENKIKGFSFSIFVWLLFTFIYDGIFLFLLFYLKDYPLETFSIIATIFNPIDLARILIMLKFDTAAMLGFSGAVFKNLFGSSFGIIIASINLLVWVGVPLLLSLRVWKKKDF